MLQYNQDENHCSTCADYQNPRSVRRVTITWAGSAHIWTYVIEESMK